MKRQRTPYLKGEALISSQLTSWPHQSCLMRSTATQSKDIRPVQGSGYVWSAHAITKGCQCSAHAMETSHQTMWYIQKLHGL
jgi:hypothetical protein